MHSYTQKFLPGCGRSVDVIHLKLSNCLAGDVNLAKGKEGYPSLAFEVITGCDRQILGVSQIHCLLVIFVVIVVKNVVLVLL